MQDNADFMADGPQKAPAPWIPLVTDKQNKWPMVVGAEAGKGYVISGVWENWQAGTF